MAELSLALLMDGGFRAHDSGMRKSMSIVMAVATLLAGSARAVEIPNLYGGQAIVTGILEPERTRGLRQILLDVLVKVSAEPRLIDDPRVPPLLDRAKDFVASYDYEDRMKGTPVRDEQGTRDRPHDLRVSFDKAKVDAALGEFGLQPWGAERPLVVAFIVVEYPGNKFALTEDSKLGLGQRQALEAAAVLRGIKVILGDYFANPAPNAQPIKSPEVAMLLGELRWQPDKASWHTAWHLTNIEKTRSWTVETPSFDEAFRNGVGEAAATLAGRR